MLERMVRPQRGSKNRLKLLSLKTNCLNSNMRKQCSWHIFSCGHYWVKLGLQRWNTICFGFEIGSCYSIKTLKCKEICMSLVPQGLKIYYEGKTKWTMACQLAWTLGVNLHFEEMETSEILSFNHLRSLNLNYTITGLSKIYLMIIMEIL